MNSIKKIYANKNDSCATIVNKIISSGADELILYLPKKSVIAENPKNFKLLKREVVAVNKKVIIESVDADILEIAASCGFEIMDGVFNRSSVSRATIADIMPVKSKISSITKNSKNYIPLKLSVEGLFKARQINYARPSDNRAKAEEQDNLEEEKRMSFFVNLLKKIGFYFLVITGAFIVGYLIFFELPKATISIERQKIEWSFAGDITASIRATEVSLKDSAIPAQIFIISKNHIDTFPASGVEIIERRATGIITIWNAYSSARQPLVQNTRFITPDGKVYRLTSPVVVPGATIIGGRIQASSIEAEVVADAPGEAYNISPVARLRLPGFQGSPRYNDFHGELKKGASGGFMGERKVPTIDDISKAREAVTAKIEAATDHAITTSIPPEFKTITTAITHEIIKEGVASEVNEQGEFSYGVMMETKVPAYKESDLIALMRQKFQAERANLYDLMEQDLSYVADPAVHFATGRISIPLRFVSKWARSFDAEAFRTSIIGVDDLSMRAAVLTIPGILNADAKLWPFWVNTVPRDPSKVIINVN